MAQANVKLESWKARKAEEAIQEAAVKTVTWATFAIMAYAKMRAPVDTGFLRNSIIAIPPKAGSLRGAKIVGVVAATASYAIYLELGTRYMTARPFLIPALEQVAPVFARKMKTIGIRL